MLKATFDRWMSAAGREARTLPRFLNREDGRADDDPAPSTQPDVTVVVPTRNEAGNVATLVKRLEPALAGHRAELLFVDDSDDATPEAVLTTASRCRLSIRVLHRERRDRSGGLGGAVLLGLRAARAPWVVVMDGDLQHPPEIVPRLLDAADERTDLVVASRYCENGSRTGLNGRSRRAVSGGATLLTRAFFPLRLRGISDPMSGFFAVRRAALSLDGLHPIGFKILLELIARTPRLRSREVPFVFAERGSGRSKATLAEGIRFARHLSRLVASRIPGIRRPGAIGRGLGFATVGVTGIVTNGVILWLLADPATLHMQYLVAAVIATQASTTWNFLLVDNLVYRGPKRGTVVTRWLGFLAMSNAVLLFRLPLLALLVSVLGMHYLLANLLTLLLGFLTRFAASERLVLDLEHQ
jgi:glycosyltransferase involved in cell wall biosynthesis